MNESEFNQMKAKAEEEHKSKLRNVLQKVAQDIAANQNDPAALARIAAHLSQEKDTYINEMFPKPIVKIPTEAERLAALPQGTPPNASQVPMTSGSPANTGVANPVTHTAPHPVNPSSLPK